MFEVWRITGPVLSGSVQFCQSPNSSPTGPWWNQVLVSVGGRKVLAVDFGEAGASAPCRPAAVIFFKGFGIELLHHAEAAKFPFGAVPIAVMIAVLGGELALGEMIDDLDTGHYLHRKRQGCLPAAGGAFLIFQIKARGGAYSTFVTAPMWLSISFRR